MWRSLGKERAWEEQSRRPCRKRISSGSVHIRWNLKGGGVLASPAGSSSSGADSVLGIIRLGLGLGEGGGDEEGEGG